MFVTLLIVFCWTHCLFGSNGNLEPFDGPDEYAFSYCLPEKKYQIAIERFKNLPIPMLSKKSDAQKQARIKKDLSKRIAEFTKHGIPLKEFMWHGARSGHFYLVRLTNISITLDVQAILKMEYAKFLTDFLNTMHTDHWITMRYVKAMWSDRESNEREEQQSDFLRTALIEEEKHSREREKDIDNLKNVNQRQSVQLGFCNDQLKSLRENYVRLLNEYELLQKENEELRQKQTSLSPH